MRKGRTYRKRSFSRKTTLRSPINSEIIDLQKWVKKVGYVIHKKIKLTQFSNTGRGIMALEAVDKNDVLMRVPFKAIITMFTLESDASFKDAFFNLDSESNKFCCQELLAFYLIYLKSHIQNHQFWVPYLKSLPEGFDNPYFHEVPSDAMDDRIKNNVNLQKEKIQKSFSRFKNIWDNVSEKNNSRSHFFESFSLDLYEWAYFVVNTRCVYVKPEIISEICTVRNCSMPNLLSHVSDEPSLALIPYLDMFNHSSVVQTLAVLKSPYDDELTEKCNFVTKLDSDLNLYFELTTLTSFKKYEEIFISYGGHCNIKLFTEYGFRIPDNPFSNLIFNFKEVCDFVTGNNVSLSISKEKYNFILQHKLNNNLFITSDGFSFNFIRLLFILTNDCKSEWNLKIFSDNFSEIELEKVNKLGKKILYEKKNFFQSVLNNFQNTNVNFSNLSIHFDVINENIYLIDNILNVEK